VTIGTMIRLALSNTHPDFVMHITFLNQIRKATLSFFLRDGVLYLRPKEKRDLCPSAFLGSNWTTRRMFFGRVFFRQEEVFRSLPFSVSWGRGEVGPSVASATAALAFDFKEQKPFSIF